MTLRCQDGLVIAPSSPVQSRRSHALRLFAERGAQVLAHPDVVGTGSSWRQAPSLSGSSVAAWEVLLVRKHREGVMSMAVGVVLFVGGVILLVTGGRGRASAVGIGLFFVGLAGVIQAKKSLKALRRARQARSAPPQRMRVRLWWSTGRGSGPAAMVSLAPLTSAHPDGDAVHFEAVNVPPQVPSGEWTEAEVRGDPSEGGTPIVRLGDIEVWPVTEATRLLRRPSWADWWRKSGPRVRESVSRQGREAVDDRIVRRAPQASPEAAALGVHSTWAAADVLGRHRGLLAASRPEGVGSSADEVWPGVPSLPATRPTAVTRRPGGAVVGRLR